jgi:translation elongation factor EF-1beta
MAPSKRSSNTPRKKNKALMAIIAILYNGTEVDLDELEAKVKSFAKPNKVSY